MSRKNEFEPGEKAQKRDQQQAKIDEILSEVNGQLKSIAQRNLPRSIIHQDVADLEVDDLAQDALIKLWQVLEKEEITYPRAYARRIVFNTSMDMLRRYKPTDQLPLDERGELEQGQILFVASEGTDDPAALVEQQDTLTCSLRIMVEDVLGLPLQQRRAMICELKEQIDDLLPISAAFSERGIDISAINWSQDERKLRSQRVSLSVARRKLRAGKERYFSL